MNEVHEKPKLSADNQIELNLNCGMCLDELIEQDLRAQGISMQEYAHLDVGFTKRGLQVWCVRHDVNVCNIDFEGTAHPAVTSRNRKADENVAEEAN